MSWQIDKFLGADKGLSGEPTCAGVLVILSKANNKNGGRYSNSRFPNKYECLLKTRQGRRGVEIFVVHCFGWLGGGLGDLGWERPLCNSKLGYQDWSNGWGVLGISLGSCGGRGWEFLSMTFFVRKDGTEILISSVPSCCHDVGPLPMDYYVPSESYSKP